MKNFLCILFSILTINTSAQCLDVFGTPSDCPTAEDSLVVYNNSLKVYEFYEKSSDYVKLESKRLRTRKDVVDCFYLLQEAVDSFTIRWQMREQVLAGANLPNVLLPRDGKNIPVSAYYQYVDAYRFYQRELENGILNTNSPFPIYDTRIAPLIINSYENRHGNDGFNGDYVNVALYIPVTVKPFIMLTDSEKVIRKKILEGGVPVKIKSSVKPIKPVKKIRKSISDTTLLESSKINYLPPIINKVIKFTSPPSNAKAFYYHSPYGGGYLIGYMVNRKFRKYLPTDEYYDILPKWVKEFLNNDKELEKYLKIIWGGYYDGIYQ